MSQADERLKDEGTPSGPPGRVTRCVRDSASVAQPGGAFATWTPAGRTVRSPRAGAPSTSGPCQQLRRNVPRDLALNPGAGRRLLLRTSSTQDRSRNDPPTPSPASNGKGRSPEVLGPPGERPPRTLRLPNESLRLNPGHDYRPTATSPTSLLSLPLEPLLLAPRRTHLDSHWMPPKRSRATRRAPAQQRPGRPTQSSPTVSHTSPTILDTSTWEGLLRCSSHRATAV
jgi:hypothetical protein